MDKANNNVESAHFNDRKQPAVANVDRVHDNANRDSSEMLNISTETTTRNRATSMGGANPFSDADENGNKLNDLSAMMLEYIPGLVKNAKTKYHGDPWKLSKVDQFYPIIEVWLKKVIRDEEKIQGFKAGHVKKWIGIFNEHMERVDAADRTGDSSKIIIAKEMVDAFIQRTHFRVENFN